MESNDRLVLDTKQIMDSVAGTVMKEIGNHWRRRIQQVPLYERQTTLQGLRSYSDQDSVCTFTEPHSAPEDVSNIEKYYC